MLDTPRIVMAAALVVSLGAAACDKIPGLAKKDADGGTVGSGRKGVLSFLGGTFEGEITMAVSGSTAGTSAPKQMVFGIKSPKVRLDTTGGPAGPAGPAGGDGAAFIIDPPAKKGYMLIASQKKAMVIDFDKAKQAAAGLPGGKGGAVPAPPSEPPKIEKTGKTDVVAGYECEEWKITSKTSRVDMCVAEGIRWLDLGDLGMGSPEVTLAAAATNADRFPLRVIGYDAKGAQTSRMEATKIEKKTLDAARFAVPPDYQIIDMAALMGGLGGLGQVPNAPGGRVPPGLPPGFTPPKPK